MFLCAHCHIVGHSTLKAQASSAVLSGFLHTRSMPCLVQMLSQNKAALAHLKRDTVAIHTVCNKGLTLKNDVDCLGIITIWINLDLRMDRWIYPILSQSQVSYRNTVCTNTLYNRTRLLYFIVVNPIHKGTLRVLRNVCTLVEVLHLFMYECTVHICTR